MKRNKYHILYTWLLLVCFIAGQYMIYSHQHNLVVGNPKSAWHNVDSHPKQTVTDNCRLCDAMHHNAITLSNLVYFAPVVLSSYFYKAINRDFVSIALVLAAGRAPPMA